MAPSAHNTALHAWNQSVAEVFAKLANSQMIGETSLTRDLSSCGIVAKVTPGDANVVNVSVEPDPAAGLPAGTTRDDFTQAKLAKIDATALRYAKDATWRLIKSRSQRGYLSSDASNALLDALGFTARPTERTNVSGYIETDSRDRYGDRVSEYVGLVLPGNVSRADVLAKLGTVFNDRATALAAAFPEAINAPEPFHQIQVSVESAWPEYSEFHGDDNGDDN